MKIQVKLPQHEYQLTIEKNLLNRVGHWVKTLWEPQKIMIITDETVASLYGDQVVTDIRSAGFDAEILAVPAGENSKSLQQAALIYDALAQKGLTRTDGIIALGGGVVGDLAGFVASTYMRGLHFLQIPTTLLAQVDSSIGGKTAVNSPQAKNLIGTFAQPDGVLIDPATLQTLEPRRVREGIAEIVKSAAIADKELWAYLAALQDENELLIHAEEIIAACCTIKKTVVEQDEHDTGIRLILNFGHTIGHAIEQTVGYGIITHGEAVSLGMIQIAQQAEAKKEMPQGITRELAAMLTKFHLPIVLEQWEEEKLYTALTHDKKTTHNTIRIVLLTEIGHAKVTRIPIEEMKTYLKK